MLQAPCESVVAAVNVGPAAHLTWMVAPVIGLPTATVPDSVVMGVTVVEALLPPPPPPHPETSSPKTTQVPTCAKNFDAKRIAVLPDCVECMAEFDTD